MENMGLSRRNSCPKVHSSLCSELTMMLDKVSSILPSIEAARPGCKAGIQELCNLYNIVEKGKLITQHCIECSKLYLAITGEAILSRCERVRDALKRSLFLIQNMCCLKILRNLCDVEEAMVLITRTDRCLGSIAEYLDTGSPKERELAVIILLTICSRSAEDCSHVMKEGVIPALVDLSVNGVDEAKTCSFKLLNLLRDMRQSDQVSNSCSQEVAVAEAVQDPPAESPVHKQQIPKSSGFFQRKLNIFSKPRSVTLF
uniref:Uncharacterized protein n=1 Tax=Avena sativa TaxID=4498 RepID=A0ACD5ZI07_AVESA